MIALLIDASLVALGAGGSIVTMPVLVYAAGLDAHQAAGHCCWWWSLWPSSVRPQSGDRYFRRKRDAEFAAPGLMLPSL